MNSKTVLLAVFCFAFVCTVSAGNDKRAERKFLCMGEEVVVDEKHKESMKACWEEAEARHSKKGGDEGKHHHHHHHDACLSACMMTKNGEVQDGKYDVTKTKEQVNAKFPEKVREAINAELQKCADGQTETLSMDDNCKSYEGLVECSWKAIMNNCRSNSTGNTKDDYDEDEP